MIARHAAQTPALGEQNDFSSFVECQSSRVNLSFPSCAEALCLSDSNWVHCPGRKERIHPCDLDSLFQPVVSMSAFSLDGFRDNTLLFSSSPKFHPSSETPRSLPPAFTSELPASILFYPEVAPAGCGFWNSPITGLPAEADSG